MFLPKKKKEKKKGGEIFGLNFFQKVFSKKFLDLVKKNQLLLQDFGRN